MATDQVKKHGHLTAERAGLHQQFAKQNAAGIKPGREKGTVSEAPNLPAIGKLAIQLAAVPPEADLFELLAESLQSISGALLVAISTYDARTCDLTVRHIATDSQDIPQANEVLGQSLFSLRIPVSPDLHCEMLAEVIRTEQDLFATTFGAIPSPRAAAVQQILGIGHFAGLALSHGGELMGTAVMAMPRGQPSLPNDTLKILAHLAAASLRRRQAEEALREREELYRTLVETSPDGILLMDLESNILTANQELVKLFGYDRAEDLVGRNGLSFLTVEEQQAAAENRRDLLACGVLRDREYRLPRRDGETLPVEVSLSLVKDAHDDPKAIIGVVRDISERKQMEETVQQRVIELQNTQARLIDAAKMAAVGELAAGVAHELNNPLTVILGFADLLLERIATDDLDRPRLEAIARQAIRIRDTVANLLSFSRQTHFHRERTDVNRVLWEALALIRLRLKASGIVVREQYAPDLPPLSLDTGRMKQVFLNLITNALQAMPHGGTLTVLSERQGDQVAIRIADTGAGIAPRHLPHIFEPFFTTKPVGDGSGLGLPVSRGIVEKHDGSIQVESTEGTGSTFTVWLPVEAQGSAPD